MENNGTIKPEGEEFVLNSELVTYIAERSQNIARHSDKLSEAFDKIDKYFEKIGPKAGIRFTDPEVFFEENNEYLGKVTYKLSVRPDWGLWAFTHLEAIPNKLIADSSRAMKKSAIRRLPVFLSLYAEDLKKYEKEYETVAEKAQKIAEILEVA